jgi:hypothetical protein
MGAVKPWHLLICLVLVIAIAGISAAIIAAGRRR